MNHLIKSMCFYFLSIDLIDFSTYFILSINNVVINNLTILPIYARCYCVNCVFKVMFNPLVDIFLYTSINTIESFLVMNLWYQIIGLNIIFDMKMQPNIIVSQRLSESLSIPKQHSVNDRYFYWTFVNLHKVCIVCDQPSNLMRAQTWLTEVRNKSHNAFNIMFGRQKLDIIRSFLVNMDVTWAHMWIWVGAEFFFYLKSNYPFPHPHILLIHLFIFCLIVLSRK